MVYCILPTLVALEIWSDIEMSEFHKRQPLTNKSSTHFTDVAFSNHPFQEVHHLQMGDFRHPFVIPKIGAVFYKVVPPPVINWL